MLTGTDNRESMNIARKVSVVRMSQNLKTEESDSDE